jgi:pimeloyl-ACP methyl ester carboxylesterase
VLVGHSDGGSIALIFAGGTPVGPVLGVVTEAAHVFCEELTLRSIQLARTGFESGDLRPRLERYHGANTECAFRGWCDTWLHPDFRSWDITGLLPAVRVPVLAIQGEQDEYGSVAQVEAIVRGADAERLLLPGCGHTPHRERPDETLEAMHRFVSRILGGRVRLGAP